MAKLNLRNSVELQRRKIGREVYVLRQVNYKAGPKWQFLWKRNPDTTGYVVLWDAMRKIETKEDAEAKFERICARREKRFTIDELEAGRKELEAAEENGEE